jgi:hypothetical protein
VSRRWGPANMHRARREPLGRREQPGRRPVRGRRRGRREPGGRSRPSRRRGRFWGSRWSRKARWDC